LLVVLFLFGALCERVELREAVTGLSAIGAGAATETSIPEADETVAASLDPAAATSATTGANSATLCVSGAMEVSTTGVSMAVTCGIGAARTTCVWPNDPTAEAIETETDLDLGLAAYTMMAAPTPTAKRMESTCSYTISCAPECFISTRRLLDTSQSIYTKPSISAAGGWLVWTSDPSTTLISHSQLSISSVSGLTYPLDKLCTQIFKFDRRIRYASVLDDTGRIIAGGMRKGISSLEPLSEDLRLMANLTIQIGTDKTWDRYFGTIQFTFVKREKVNMMTFNLGENFMLVSTEPDFELQQAANLRDTVMTIYSTGMIPERTR